MPSKVGHVLAENKHWVFSWISIVVAIALLVHFWPGGPSPVPAQIRAEVSFPIIYPQGYSFDPQGWKYLQGQSSLQFTAKKDNYSVVFNEEETPLAYQNDAAAYDRFVGSLRPTANFNVSLGTVSIVNFVTAGDYEVVGETGMLNAKGTLLLAHPDTQLTDDQWRSLFEALKVEE